MKKFIASILLLGLAAVSFYFSLFWGWASGAVSPSDVGWSAWYKNASNMAFGVFRTMLRVDSGDVARSAFQKEEEPRKEG